MGGGAGVKEIEAANFWHWAYSDFLSNALRGILAEYIVARAVGCTHRPRVEWDAYDLKTDSGLKIEVKSAAYLQSWVQKQLSPIRFSVGPKRGWDAETNVYAAEATRSADAYVFCVFASQDRETANPLNLEQWFFMVCRTTLLNQAFPTQKSVSLASLEALGLERVSFDELGPAVEREAASPSPGLTADG